MAKSAAVVAIVGRTNVGKSSLFNALIGQRAAIVAKEAGTTRDRVTAKASYKGNDFWLVDTAGMKTAEDEFELSIQDQIAQAAKDADLILVVTEAQTPVGAEDRAVATMALKSRKPVILVINKIDKNQQADLAQWQTLGIKTILATSITQKTGLDELLGTITSHLPPVKIKVSSDRIQISILGRPNVGKSYLFNKLAAKQQAQLNARQERAVRQGRTIQLGQALVAEQAGTTRDVNRLVIRYHEREIELADTAGIRRPGRVERGVEHFSVLRALTAIEQSDICLLVMDAIEPNTQLDQRIAGLIKEASKGLILVTNKWDKVEGSISREAFSAQVANSFPFVPWAPLIFTSAKTGQNVTKIYDLVLEIDKERRRKFKTSELNKWLRHSVDSNEPPPSRGYLPKLNYMVQEEDMDFPSFKIFGSHSKYLHWSYKRYLERQFREQWPLIGTPLKFWFIDKART